MHSRTLATRLTALVAAAAFIAGCQAERPIPIASNTPAVPQPPATAAPAEPDPAASPSAGPTRDPASERPDLAAVRVALEPVVDGLDQPLWVTGAGDGSGRLFVGEQPGRIRVIRDGRLAAKPFLDITDRVASGGERGLLGFAFPPGFGAQQPAVYVHYSNRDGDTTISRFRLDPHDIERADPGSEEVVLTVEQPYPNHNGGWVGFDPDGMLLVALGDGGAGGDPENRASNPAELLGKILRLDVLGATTGEGYAIPADNPFTGTAGARPEILHLGLRNPFRASIDPATGSLWIGDVGQNAWEEVDVAPADARGLDFGWRRWEGRHCFDPPEGCSPDGVTMPVAEYGHGAGCSVIGGIVYRGDAIPALRGGYLFADYCSGTLWAINASAITPQVPATLAETGRSISAIGTGDDGEVYVTDLGGSVLALRPGS